MKRVLKTILPILLAVAIIVSIGWYFLKYDPELTRDILISQARWHDSKGNHSISTWFYNLAYRQSGEDEHVAIELAEQYKSVGNYTKAEYTLTNAIKTGGGTDLYIALCKTYVEQDKLLDAVTMLSNVGDPAIKAQLDELRPAAPVPSKESGYYNEYITVSFTTGDGSTYVTTDGIYPSQDSTPYTQPIELPGGLTTVMALTVGDNGLVSPLSILDYTVAGVIEPVELADAAIDHAVRELLKVDESHILYSNELWSITELRVPKDATTLSDLNWMPFLQKLTIQGATVENLSSLTPLSSLETLVISNISVAAQDLQIIANLPKLTSLTMTDCKLSGITELSGAAGLTHLDLSSNTIRDLSALGTMPYLQSVDLSHNALDSIEVLGNLTNLIKLDVSFNSITSAAPLASCSHLSELDLSNNYLTNLNGIEKLLSLTKLSTAYNKITEVNNISTCVDLVNLDISNNSITDISGLSTLEKLTSLDFSYNNVTALPAFTKNCTLVTVKGSHNQLISLSHLAALSQLNYVIMDYNAGVTSVSALTKCSELVEISVYGTGVTDVSALKEKNPSVIIHYSPI